MAMQEKNNHNIMNYTVHSARKKHSQTPRTTLLNIATLKKKKSVLSFWRGNERTNRMKRTELFKSKNVQMLHSF